MKRLSFVFSSLAVLGLLAGCQQGVEVVSESKPASVDFTGQMDDRFVNLWVTEGGSEYDLKADGTYHLEAVVSTQGGTFQTESDGKWLVNDDMLLFQDANNVVSQYKYSFDGEELRLDSKGEGKKVTVFTPMEESDSEGDGAGAE